jgi:hypothetical protein
MFLAPATDAPVWSVVDADDRFPGRFDAHVTAITMGGIEFRVRITPGDRDTYLAPGFTADIDGGRGHQWTLTVPGAGLDRLKAAVVDDLADELQGW